MRKKSLLTKVVALGATATLLASTTAFAEATYSTRTLYLKSDANTAYVSTTVTGLSEGDEVTYLAGYTEGNTPVYINQFTAEGENLTFKYKTSKDNLGASKEIKMAKADKTFTVNGTVTPATAGEDKIPEAQKFTFNVTVDNGTAQAIAVNAGDVIDADTITLTGITLGDGTLGTTAKLDDADATVAVVADGVSVTLPANFVSYDDNTLVLTKTSATLALTTTPAVEPAIDYVSGVKASSYTYTYTPDGSTEETSVSGPMFAIYGKVTGTVDEYGIAVSYDGEEGTYAYYKADGKDDDGTFGVAVIDDNEGATTIDAYAKTYIKVGDAYTYGAVKHIVAGN